MGSFECFVDLEGVPNFLQKYKMLKIVPSIYLVLFGLIVVAQRSLVCADVRDCSESSSPKSHFCCSTENKCGEFEGDCDNDDHCKAGLKCGDNNCPRAFEDRSFDCCYDPDVYSRSEELPNDYLGNNYDCEEERIGDGTCDEENYHPSMWCGPYDGGDCDPKIDLMGDGKCDEQNNFLKFQNYPYGSFANQVAEH